MKTKYNGYISETNSRGRSGSRSPNMPSEATSNYGAPPGRRVSSHKSSRLRLLPVTSDPTENYGGPVPHTSAAAQKKVMFADELSSHQSRVKQSRSTLSSQSHSKERGSSASPDRMEYYQQSPSTSDLMAGQQPSGSRYEIDKNVRAFESGYYSSSGNSTAPPAVAKHSKKHRNQGDRELKNILI